MRFLEHPKRLSHTGAHADINFKLTPPGLFNQIQEILNGMFFIGH
jgi:hypothetical protein